jgi:hypothetical protein
MSVVVECVTECKIAAAVVEVDKAVVENLGLEQFC